MLVTAFQKSAIFRHVQKREARTKSATALQCIHSLSEVRVQGQNDENKKKMKRIFHTRKGGGKKKENG